jgi:enoyl-CoA hydratase
MLMEPVRMPDVDLRLSERIATVTLNRPPVHALTTALYTRLAEVFEELGQSREVQCAILTATGHRAFCAGKDLHEFLATTVEEDPAKAAVARRTFSAILDCAVPVIAAVNGPALGAGAVIAAMCDIRLAAEHATFGLPEINVGRCGGGAPLGRLLPQGTLRRMFFTGQPIDAAEAYRLGFVDAVTTTEALMGEAQRLAGVIASKAPLGIRLGKKALNEVEGLPVKEGYALEQRYSTTLMATEDAREATRAVLEKRAPVFKGR